MRHIEARVTDIVLSRFSEALTLEDLASAVGMSRWHFCRRFQSIVGVSPIRWLWALRTQLAATFIELEPRWTLTDVAFACGFGSSAHFSRAFKAAHGVSPSAYRQRAHAEAEPRRGPLLTLDQVIERRQPRLSAVV
jgi:AraC-like DNA-binding protein